MEKENFSKLVSGNKSEITVSDILRHLHAIPASEFIIDEEDCPVQMEVALKKERASPGSSVEGVISVFSESPLKFQAICMEVACLIEETTHPKRKLKLCKSRTNKNLFLSPLSIGASSTLALSTKNIQNFKEDNSKDDEDSQEFKEDEESEPQVQTLKKFQTHIGSSRTIMTKKEGKTHTEKISKKFPLLKISKRALKGNINFLIPFKIDLDKDLPPTVESTAIDFQEDLNKEDTEEQLDPPENLAIQYYLKVFVVKKFVPESLEYILEILNETKFIVESNPVEKSASFLHEFRKPRQRSLMEVFCGVTNETSIESRVSKTFIVQNALKPLQIDIKLKNVDVSEFYCCSISLKTVYEREDSFKEVLAYRKSIQRIESHIREEIFGNQVVPFAPTISSDHLKITSKLVVALERLQSAPLILINQMVELIPERSTKKNKLPSSLSMRALNRINQSPFGSISQQNRLNINLPFTKMEFNTKTPSKSHKTAKEFRREALGAIRRRE